MAPRAGAVADWSQEPGTPCGFHKGGKGSNRKAIFHCFCWCIRRKLGWKLSSWDLKWAVWYGMLVSKTAVQPAMPQCQQMVILKSYDYMSLELTKKKKKWLFGSHMLKNIWEKHFLLQRVCVAHIFLHLADYLIFKWIQQSVRGQMFMTTERGQIRLS